MGNIVIQLDPELAPITVDNFYAYVDGGFYDGTDGLGATTFHRVAAGFVIQGGGVTEEGVMKGTMSPIVNESGNGLTNARGTIAMARTSDPDSATSQFFINLVDNFALDTPPGYAVFGEVVEGLDVVDAIGAVATTMDEPNEPIVITTATRL
jgi:cyclophilin family peptidyl-prolyl cis-trans isomerase